MNQHISSITRLYGSVFNVPPDRVEVLPPSGSPRIYFRLFAGSYSIVGAFNDDVDENRAFLYLAEHFRAKQLPVPEVIAVSPCEKYYLQTDLGALSLFDLVCRGSTNLDTLLEEAIRQLVRFQVEGAQGLNSARCFPISSFDRRSVMWDLNYFKYCFLKPSGLPFSEVKLEDAFNCLADTLLAEDLGFFLYRDFQSRNIMVQGSRLYFIDFQGGRLGPCLYDLASFLYQARAGFAPQLRERLLNLYLDELAKRRPVSTEHLRAVFPTMAMFRIIQTLGAYGFRGFFEKKAHFIQSIPGAIANYLHLAGPTPSDGLGYIASLLGQYRTLTETGSAECNGLTVEITSFSLRKGYPDTHPEHGGGFVFDCRSLPNPGRIDRYKHLTGFDSDVADYLNGVEEVTLFNSRVFDIVSSAIENYIQRKFAYLSIAFGCTGGQHRSVYCATILAQKLSGRYDVNIKVVHREVRR